MENPNSPRPKKARQAKRKANSILIIFFNTKEIAHTEFSQFSYYCDVLRRLRETVRRLHPEFWRQNNRLLHHDNAPSHTSFFTGEFLNKNNMTVVPHPPYFSLFPQTEDKTERLPFWHNWGDRGRIASGAEHPQRKRLPGWFKTAGALG
jgi:hypothetical protein